MRDILRYSPDFRGFSSKRLAIATVQWAWRCEHLKAAQRICVAAAVARFAKRPLRPFELRGGEFCELRAEGFLRSSLRQGRTSPIRRMPGSFRSCYSGSNRSGGERGKGALEMKYVLTPGGSAPAAPLPTTKLPRSGSWASSRIGKYPSPSPFISSSSASASWADTPSWKPTIWPKSRR